MLCEFLEFSPCRMGCCTLLLSPQNKEESQSHSRKCLIDLDTQIDNPVIPWNGIYFVVDYIGEIFPWFCEFSGGETGNLFYFCPNLFDFSWSSHHFCKQNTILCYHILPTAFKKKKSYKWCVWSRSGGCASGSADSLFNPTIPMLLLAASYLIHYLCSQLCNKYSECITDVAFL